jgi:DNA-binding NarL/FixJ family response regulator
VETAFPSYLNTIDDCHGLQAHEETGMHRTTVLLVENSPEFLHLLKRLLRSWPDIEIVGEADNGRQALLLAQELRPEVVLMDVHMPVLNGLESTRFLNIVLPDVKVIILSMFDIEEYEKEALSSGASGYILKKNMAEELLPAIQQARAGSVTHGGESA